MKESISIKHEQLAADAFNRQSAVFDKIYAENITVSYKRKRVRNHVLKLIKPGSNILELNAGTGDDAVFFAQQGHTVHATDIAGDMQDKLRIKVQQCNVSNLISTEICSYTQLENLQNKGPYDLIFSNFGGLNCTGDLQKVLGFFNSLLKPGGIATIVVMPKFCLWENMLALRGDFKTAFRRLKHTNGTPAHIEGVHFLCWYYSPSYIQKVLKKDFDLINVEGLCTIVPPSYMENFPKKHPQLFNWLIKKEERFKGKFPWKNIGDYFIISLRKNKLSGSF